MAGVTAEPPREPAWVSAQLSALPDPLWAGRPSAGEGGGSHASAVTGLRRALRALGVAALAGSALGALLVLRSRHVPEPDVNAALAVVLGASFVAAGLAAWERRPDNRTGALLTLVGFAWLASTLAASNYSLSFTLGVAAAGAWPAALVHTLLAFPGGRLSRPSVRGLVMAGYGMALLHAGSVLLGAGPYRCQRCPSLLAEDGGAAASAQTLWVVDRVGMAVVVLVAAGVLVHRLRKTSFAHRRGLDTVLVPGIAALVLLPLPALFAGGPGVAADWGPLTWPGRAGALLVPIGFVVGALRGRFFRATAVAELVDRLSDPSRPGLAGLALARALGDPSLSLAYWLPDERRYVDNDGRPVELPGPESERVVTDVEREGRPVAAIVHDASLCAEPDLVRQAGAAAAMALENERLQAALRARVEDLRDSRARMVRAADGERRRLERNLHDGAQQRLVATSLRLRLAMGKVREDPETSAGMLDEAFEELQLAIEDLRELARGIHPAVLSDRGLRPALATLAARASIPVEVQSDVGERLDAPVEAAAYYVVAEALTNVAKYAQATHASVRVDRDERRIVVEVTDDGVGGADPAHGSGLRGLWDRVGALDGRIEVVSPPGEGTRVRAEFPSGE
jgi:signal transduction histidine kinase